MASGRLHDSGQEAFGTRPTVVQSIIGMEWRRIANTTQMFNCLRAYCLSYHVPFTSALEIFVCRTPQPRQKPKGFKSAGIVNLLITSRPIICSCVHPQGLVAHVCRIFVKVLTVHFYGELFKLLICSSAGSGSLFTHTGTLGKHLKG